jgi:murein L,D-transpeptidase YafK
MSRTSLFLLITISLLLWKCGKSEKAFGLSNDLSLTELLDSLSINHSEIFLFIDKSEYTLSVKYQDRSIRSYPVVFGGNPIDDKRMEGDQCTPEGKFKVRAKYPHKDWSKFVWLNYPTEESRKKHREAKGKGEIPENAKIGGEIGIHGVPEGYEFAIPLKINWTLGCISMTNAGINDLYPCITEKIIIEITP